MSAKLLRICSIAIVFCFSITGFASPKSILPIKKWVTSSGMPVFYVYTSELPIVDIQVAFDAGSARDLSQPGLAKITNDALSSGTKSKNADTIAAAFDNVGAKFSSAVNRDMAVVALRSLSDPKFFQPAFTTFSDVLTSASFPNDEFVRIQKQTLNNLDEQEESPASIASKAFYTAVFDDNPYGHPIYGTKAAISKMTTTDLKSFFSKFYTAQNGLIAIVGNVDEARAKQLAEELSSHLNKGQQQATLTFNLPPQKKLNQHIAFPSSQTHVLIGQMGITRNDPAYFPVVVGNYILGGGMLTSRLFEEVRDKRGLAYNVRSQFSALKDKGPFMIELQTRNSEAKNAIQVVNETLDKFIKLGPTQQEMNAAKKNLTQGFILRLANNSAIINQLVSIGFYHLPLNYLDTYQSNIASVSDQQIKSVFQNIIHPNNLVTVTVGNGLADSHEKSRQ